MPLLVMRMSLLYKWVYDCEWVCVCIFGQGNYYSHGQAQNICFVSNVLPKWKIMTIFIIETLELIEKVVYSTAYK